MTKKHFISVAVALILLAVALYLNQFHGWFILKTPSFDETYVSLRFDDGWKSQLNAYELLKKYNLTGSIYIISGFMGKEGYMSWADVEKVSEIMEIGGHTVNHADLKNLRTSQDYENEIGNDFRTLTEKGFKVKTFVYPYGNYNNIAVRVVKKYYIGASTQDIGVNTQGANLFLLKDFTIRSFNSIKDIKRVIIPGTWTILTFHDVGEPHPLAPSAVKGNAVSLEFFEEILKWLKENDIKVITVAEGCEMLKSYESKKTERK
jgi:peptidoglycan/xylan/chitin deacetylase (PgdA/CDA1 family)